MAEVKLGKSPAQKAVTVKPIVEAAEMQKAPMGTRLFHAFFMVDSPKQIFDNLLFKVFVPSIKELLENMFNKGVHMMFFGDTVLTQPTTTAQNGQSFVSYGSFWNGKQPETKNGQQLLNVTGLGDFDMPIIRPTQERPDAKAAAEEVLKQMRDLIGYQGYARVSDLYMSVSRTPDWTDEYCGWYKLDGASIIPTQDGGYLVQMPKAVLLK